MLGTLSFADASDVLSSLSSPPESSQSDGDEVALKHCGRMDFSILDEHVERKDGTRESTTDGMYPLGT
jgi:hypothetical protein